MTTAHLYLFSDACPSDWLVDGQGDVWHTIVNLVFQADPELSRYVEQGMSHEDVLPRDPMYLRFVDKIHSQLPSGQLRKWGTRPSYRENFCRAFVAAQPEFEPIVSACSFQERTLRDSKTALLASYNQRIGGIEGRGIGFEETTDDRGRRRLKHSYFHWRSGYHEIQGLENQILVLLFTAWFIADQYGFYFREIVERGRYGFDQLQLTVVSDKLSGDDDLRRKSEQNLRHLIDPESDAAPLTLTRSTVSDRFSGDLLVDNLAGWLTGAMNEPRGTLAMYARNLIPTGVWTGWHHLQPSIEKLEALPAIDRLLSSSQAT